MVAIKKIFSRQRERKLKGEDISWHITRRQTGEDTSWHSTRRANAPNGSFSTLYFCYSKFTHSCRVSELREVKREIQVMPPLVLLIKFVLLLIIFQASFSLNLLVANWRLSPEFWSPNIFSTRHGDQNGRSLERWPPHPVRCPVLRLPKTATKTRFYLPPKGICTFYIRYNMVTNFVLCLWNEKHAFICPPKGIRAGWSGNAKLIRKWLPTWRDQVFEGRKMQTKKQLGCKRLLPKCKK